MSDNENVTTSHEEDRIDNLIREAVQMIDENRSFIEERKRRLRNRNRVNPAYFSIDSPSFSLINLATNSGNSSNANPFSPQNIRDSNLQTNSSEELPSDSSMNITTNDHSAQSTSSNGNLLNANHFLPENSLQTNSSVELPSDSSINTTTTNDHSNSSTSNNGNIISIQNLPENIRENSLQTNSSTRPLPFSFVNNNIHELFRDRYLFSSENTRENNIPSLATSQQTSNNNNNMNISVEDDIIYVGSTINSPNINASIVDLRTPSINRNTNGRRSLMPINDFVNLTENNYDDDEVICVGDISPPKRSRTTINNDEGEQFLMCPVCLDAIENKVPVSTLCGHVFCFKCLMQVMKTRLACPMCQKKLRKNDWHYLYLSFKLK